MLRLGLTRNTHINHTSIIWLLVAQLMVMLPLVRYLPVWLIPVLAFTTAWRFRVMQGKLQQPGALTKTVLVVAGIAALAASGMQTVSLDLMSSLLLLGFAYKTLEAMQSRDALVIILTGFLLTGVHFLYSQSMLAALYNVFTVAVLVACMISIQKTGSSDVWPNLKLAASMLLLCLPLMIALFILVPRITPLWTLNLSPGHAKTGITDRMTPGDIATVSQSDELAFRVTFLGERPAQSELYWSGLTLQYFDGGTWTQFAGDPDADEIYAHLRTHEHAIKRRLIKEGYGRQYEVIYERSAQKWLFALSPVVQIKGDAVFGSDFRIMSREDVIEPLMLTLTSYPDAPKDVELSEYSHQMNLQLPKRENPQTIALAQQLRAKTDSDDAYIEQVLQRYRELNFYYTLRPPKLSEEHSVDQFLFQSRRGFCAHYAGSFVVMMRAAGIPARVVAGYQGGEWNEQGNYLAVHQYDAHAWAEVWLEGEGWIRVDPTAMVAPQRVEKNLQTAVQSEGSFLERQLISTAKFRWLDGLRKRADATQYAWRRFVLGYDRDSQSEFMQRLFGEVSIAKAALIAGGIFVSIAGLWAVLLGIGRKQPEEALEHQLYRKYCDVLASKGVMRLPAQTPAAYAQLAALQIPAYAVKIKDFSRLYSELCYSPEGNSKRKLLLQQLRAILKQMK